MAIVYLHKYTRWWLQTEKALVACLQQSVAVFGGMLKLNDQL